MWFIIFQLKIILLTEHGTQNVLITVNLEMYENVWKWLVNFFSSYDME